MNILRANELGYWQEFKTIIVVFYTHSKFEISIENDVFIFNCFGYIWTNLKKLNFISFVKTKIVENVFW